MIGKNIRKRRKQQSGIDNSIRVCIPREGITRTIDEMYNIVIHDRLRRWKEKDNTVGL